MNDLPRRGSALRIAAATMLLLLPLVGGGTWFYRSQERQLRADLERELGTAAHLKAEQIAAWRRDRLSEGAELMERRWLIARLAPWLAGVRSPEGNDLQADFRSLQQHDHYSDVIVVDLQGRIRASVAGRTQLHDHETEALGRAWRERRPVLTDLHPEGGHSAAHISVVVPLVRGSGEVRESVASAILVTGANQFLYPLIRLWPTASQTAETLLVGRDGDTLRFLNPLRRPPKVTATQDLHGSPADLPAAMALRGREGFVEGRDYRGVPVVAFIVQVPDSPWWMIAKVDASEAFAAWRSRAVLIALLVLGGVALLSTAAFVVWERNQKAFYRSLHALEATRQGEAERYRITLNSIGDAVVTADAKGRVLSLNPVAEALTGWNQGEASGRPIDEVFRIINEGTKQPVESPVARVLREGVIVGLANHTVLLARDGAEHPIADSGAPIRDEHGAVIGVVLVFRDVGEERAAQRAQRFAEALVNRSPDPIYALDPNRDFRLVFANDAACRHFGYTREQLLSMSPADWDPHYPLPRLRETWAARGESGATVVETVNRTADGRFVPVEVFASSLEYEGTKLSVGSIRDITYRKKAEERIRFQAHLLDVVDHAIIATDAAGLITYWNRAAERLYGWPAADVLGRSVMEVTVSDATQAQAAEILEVLAAGQSWSGEFLAQRADGTTFPAHVTDTPLCDEAGGMIGVVGVSYDITARKLAGEQQRLQAAALNAAANGIVITDRDGTIKWVNPAWTALTGYTLQEVLGKNPRLLKSGVQDDAFYRSLWTTILAGEVWCAELVNRRRDGTEYVEEETITPVRDERGEVSHFIAIKHDISARKRAEQEHEHLQAQLLQAQKMESVGRLAGGVAHDFNNMLSVILGHAEMALEDLEPSHPFAEPLQEIHRAATRSGDLTRQLLAFSRQQTVAPRVLDLNDTVAGMLKMLRRLLGEDIELVWVPAPEIWPVKIDPAQLDQILANLSVNGRDAIEGVGRITIHTANKVLDEAYCARHVGAVPGEYAMLAVSDTGCGMTADVLEHVFEPFFTTKALGTGTGLGLATVYGIVKQNDGYIDLVSTPAHGTTSEIYFPRCREVPEIETVVARPPPAGRGEVVLLVEDEAAILKLGAVMLRGLGYEVLTAATPGEALELSRRFEGTIHLLITDVVMPEMNGRELAGRLVAARPDLRCLFISGYTADVIANRGVLQEGVQFLEKPFSRQRLAQKVVDALRAQ